MVLETPVVGSLRIITGMYDELELRLTKPSIGSTKRKTYILTTLYNNYYAVAPNISYCLIF